MIRNNRGKIYYSQTDILSDLRLQRSEHGNHCARSSEQQAMLALGYFSTSETIVVSRDRKSCPKIHPGRKLFGVEFQVC